MNVEPLFASKSKVSFEVRQGKRRRTVRTSPPRAVKPRGRPRRDAPTLFPQTLTLVRGKESCAVRIRLRLPLAVAYPQ